ncbi:hypothetical protein GCM10023213_37390 [Prosthecobacter algae]|uniref:Uncharacterized protein n=1 Tax=Prosthecobacter algae TaxID=1144682 RepID=A0ABP9PF63_9BACT
MRVTIFFRASGIGMGLRGFVTPGFRLGTFTAGFAIWGLAWTATLGRLAAGLIPGRASAFGSPRRRCFRGRARRCIRRFYLRSGFFRGSFLGRQAGHTGG